MNNILKLSALCLFMVFFLISCTKQPLTLDEKTPMKRLLKASDKEISELVAKEAFENANLTEDDISIEYILRDEKNQAIAVKIKSK